MLTRCAGCWREHPSVYLTGSVPLCPPCRDLVALTESVFARGLLRQRDKYRRGDYAEDDPYHQPGLPDPPATADDGLCSP